ncbi:O-glucosyltransferase rumi homolog [Orussus abietinus]|uniref:O-glucosyltransferase rumi homolog n=1 Tax=Orussus abietinus TaxID=222816 RepID=UPI000625690B|nr:O-glucosyltransferase rumi homolog [Orussus abietinus]
MNVWTYTFLLLMAFNVGGEEFCHLRDNEPCTGNNANKYVTQVDSGEINERYDRYFKAIDDAQKNFVEVNCTKNRCFKDIITKDLKPFKLRGINKKLIDVAKSRGTFYQIIDGQLYREKDCMFPSRCSGIEHFIFEIINKLPDMDLVINTRDYPQTNQHFGEPLPIFSFSKTSQYFDIMYPTWSFWEGGPAIALYPRGLGRWDLHRKSLNAASENLPWPQKKAKAFFRGSRTSSERDNLILLSRKEPDLVDAQYTKNQAWKSDNDTLHVPPALEAPLESHCEYKYLFNYRGVAASFRHKHLFLCRSLVFHVGDEWLEFYYTLMKPWIHYIPVPKNASQSELRELIKFARDNDEISEKIANKGRDFIWQNLTMSNVIAYWRILLKRYSKLLLYKPVLGKSLIRIYKK